MDFLHTLKVLVEENESAIGATQQEIMRLDYHLSRTLQKDSIPSESSAQELSLLIQERRWHHESKSSIIQNDLIDMSCRFLQGGF
jgi:hypothetical protein